MKNKKGFTLMELILVIAILGILFAITIPKFAGFNKQSNKAAIRLNIKNLEEACLMYNVMEDDWPKIPDKEYKEINPSGYYTVNGEIEILDSMGKYYHIDYDKLKPYIDKPDNSERYILRNPKGKVYYIKGDGVLIEENTGDDENNPEETWDNSKEYVQGDIVEYNGRKYRARWYTKNEEPGLMASPWQEITDEWRDFNIYQQGDAVEYNGREYRARWYTKNEEPGGLNGPWEEL